MPKKKTFYITTPIYYVNGVPHVGSATTTLLADSIARYHRQRGDAVFFLTGTDEHAQKVADAAAKKHLDPQAFVDDVSQHFVDTWKYLGVTNDDFIRTSQPRHKKVVEEVFRRLRARGDIYAGKYEGWYSVADETFFRDSEVENGRARESGAIVERVTEDVYFFRLSAYSAQLLRYIGEHPGFLQPETRKNEVLSFIRGGLRDVAVSRRNTGWGIPVPGDPSQVVYVWFDALINYLTAAGWPESTSLPQPLSPPGKGGVGVWPADAHLVGKEIYTRFHATLWPAMLMGLGLPLPGVVLGHGWWLIEGEKGSKSKGNIPTPQEAVQYLVGRSGAGEAAAIDALRFYLVRDISFTGDAEFSYETLVSRYNAYLANDLGNLLNRTLNMVRQYTGSVVAASADRTAQGAMAGLAHEVVAEVEKHMEALNPGAAIDAAWKLIDAANKGIDTDAPWKLRKEGDEQGVVDALYNALEANRIASVVIAPFLPHASAEIRRQLGLDAAVIPDWQSASEWGLLPTGLQTAPAQPIFPRIDRERPISQEKKYPMNESHPIGTDAAHAAAAPSDKISIDDVGKVKLRVAEIKTAERIEGAKKLLRLTVDLGEGADRQLVAGIAESYAPEDLPGRKIIVVSNLQPATIRGVESNGMLLAATGPDKRAILLAPEQDVPAGSEVR